MTSRIFVIVAMIILIIFSLVYLLWPVSLCIPTGMTVSENVMANFTEAEVEEIRARPNTTFWTIGESMLPTISENMVCTCIPKDSYKIGDIVSFHLEENGVFRGITHRIVRIEQGKFVTKGDNNFYEDMWRLDDGDIACEIPVVPRVFVGFLK